MKCWELRHVIKEAVNEAADIGMSEWKESKERKKQLRDVESLAYRRLKNSVC